MNRPHLNALSDLELVTLINRVIQNNDSIVQAIVGKIMNEYTFAGELDLGYARIKHLINEMRKAYQ